MVWNASFGRLALCAATLAAVAALPACSGGGGNGDACNKIKSDLQNATKGVGSASPAQLGQQYKDAASKIRSDASGGNSDLKSAAGRVADTLDSLATTLTSGGTSLPDMSGLTQGGSDLSKICGK